MKIYLKHKKILGFYQYSQTFKFWSVLLWGDNFVINSVLSATTNNPCKKNHNEMIYKLHSSW